MTIRVGRWDCTHCNHKGNLGPDTKCINCGAPRPKNVKFYLPEDAEILKNKEEIKKAKSGADWVCSFCNSHNKAYEKNCQSCGNDRQAEDGDSSLQEIEYSLEETPLGSEKKKAKKNKIPPKKKKRTAMKIVLGIVATFLLFVVLSLFNSEINVEVTGHSWERKFKTEQNLLVSDEDWSLPHGATNISSFRAIHHYDQVPDGYETKTRSVKKKVGTKRVKIGTKDLGNGHFEDIYETQDVYENVEEKYQAQKYKDVPVYREKYKFNVFKWLKGKEAIASGNNKEPYWPELIKDPKAKDARIGEKTERYFIEIIDHKNKKHKEKVPMEYWLNVEKGDKVKAKKSSIFNSYKGLVLK